MILDIKYSLVMKTNHKTSAEWEHICKKCGACCFEKIENENGTIFFTGIPCKYLDVVTRNCKIYDRRFEIFPECIQLTEELVRNLNWLDDDCGYRQKLGIIRNKSDFSRNK